ncbi:hypothetical protein CCR94_04470 [Rhodoblastus sphagnicola]|uniref:LysR substrate-binding domain-containing protein n=1 Tax=Rhodoblastus sphagnicola TaxID=333368 RepID=A0A2S6NDJ2_9HYPH|nr:hypothetical protein CCR94_04470 [Rhodoblastus sphagnicola]
MAIVPLGAFMMSSGSDETIKQVVAAGLGLTALSRHVLALDAASGALRELDVQGFPIERQRYVAHMAAKTLSPPARGFLEILKRRKAEAVWAIGMKHFGFPIPVRMWPDGFQLARPAAPSAVRSAASSLSEVSPEAPAAPITAPAGSRISTPPGTGTMPSVRTEPSAPMK